MRQDEDSSGGEGSTVASASADGTDRLERWRPCPVDEALADAVRARDPGLREVLRESVAARIVLGVLILVVLGWGVGSVVLDGSWRMEMTIGLGAVMVVAIGVLRVIEGRVVARRPAFMCHWCGYDMDGLGAAAFCPECGRRAGSGVDEVGL